MSTTDVEGNRMSVGNKSPKSSPSKSQKGQKLRRTSPETSVPLRHGITSPSAAEPSRTFAILPTLPHGSPTSRKSHLRSPQHKKHAARQLQQPDDQGIGVVEEEPHQPSTNETDRESVVNSSASGSNDRSVPEDWFKNLNTNVGDFNKPTVADGDSPYYLLSEKQRKQRHQFNPKVRPATAAGGGKFPGNRSTNISRLGLFPNPSYPPMAPTQDSEDESDVYRSVIDDLTIKNKKLKKKLRKMERLHCNELDEEKLFEVRCYGLPPSRKQELQEILQNFAAGMDGAGRVYETKRSDLISNANATTSTNPSSSSLLQNADSAYATETRMTSLDGVSGDATKSNALNVEQEKTKPKRAPSSSLHPENRPIQFANERTRMKMVVRRLEQLFTGSDALQSELEKSQFQQKLAVAAATEKHDTVVDEVLAESGDEDDRREAAMMSPQQDDDLTKEKNQDQKSPFDPSHQRPTRPLDIDPNRAQVAAENLEYLEHLSFSPSHKSHRPASAGDTTGWVYLNLINNMAQIHTLNVSLSFIKRSIRAMSDKLELSPDGNKVRWKGGFTGTKLSSEGDSSSGMGDSSNGESSPGEGSSGLKSKTNLSSEGKFGIKAVSTKDVKSRLSLVSSPAPTPSAYNIDAFRYQPLMFHSLSARKSNSTDRSDQDGSESSSEAETNNSGGPAPILESGSNVGLNDMAKFAPIDGPVIYFGGAPFCTDLSAQVVFREGGHVFVRSGDGKSYERFVEEPVGPPAPAASGDDNDTESLDRRPLSKFDWSSQDIEMGLIDDSEEILPELTSIVSSTVGELPAPIPSPRPFEISGIGGVRPEDNFVVYIKTVQKPVPLRKSRFRKNGIIRHFIPQETLSQFFNDDGSSTSAIGFESEITKTTHIQLQPPKLPDPVFAAYLSEDSSDPFASTSDEPQSHLSFAYNIESDSRSSGEGIPSFYSPEIDDLSLMDLDAEEGVATDGNPLAPLSVIATAGSEYGSMAGSTKDTQILKSLDDMDIGPL